MARLISQSRCRGKANKAAVIALTTLVAFALIGAGIYFWPLLRWQSAMNEAQTAFAREEFPLAKEKFEKATNLAINDFGPNDPRTIETMKKLALVNGMVGQWSNVMDIYKRLYQLSTMDWVKLKIAHTALNFSDMLKNVNAPKGALRGLTTAQETVETAFGPVNAESLVIVPLIAKVTEDEERFSEAEKQHAKVQELIASSEGRDSVGMARAHQALGTMYVKWARHEDLDESGSDETKASAGKHRAQAKSEYSTASQILKAVRPSDLQVRLTELTTLTADVDQKGLSIPDSSTLIPKI
jgi:hypothetical protein